MTTEREARELWCPMARHMSESPDDVYSFNRFTGTKINLNPGSCRCIAAKCAMWRWTLASGDDGFCGLGGKP
jgi:hypothetical protein